MTYEKLTHLISASAKQRRSVFENIINSQRNRTLAIHQDYYDGNHWDVDESGSTNTTRSGKLIWGKLSNHLGSADDLLKRKNDTGNRVKFHSGQLQVHNYVKLFQIIYQDFILGQGDDEVTVIYEGEENTKEINKFLEELWVDVEPNIKEQNSRMVTTTVAIDEITFSKFSGYGVSIVDAIEFVPIYDGKLPVGGMRVYTVSAEDAELMFGLDGKEEKYVFADIYYPSEENPDQYLNTKIVDGKIVDTVPMPDELNFNPFTHVANLDHPFRDFDENNLEDSEIFNWIDRNDSLNAHETIEFITNQFQAMPKAGIDHEMMEKMGLSMSDPAFKQALSQWQYFPGSIDTTPVKLLDGKTLQPAFFTGLDRIVSALFEDAGIPKFIVNGEGMTNISAETITLGLGMLVRKISQKREQHIKRIKINSMKALKTKGFIDSDTDIRKLPISVNLPDIIGLTQIELIEKLFVAYEKGLTSREYTTKEFFKAIGKEEDAGDQISAQQGESQELLAEIEKRAGEIKSQAQVKSEIDSEKAKKKELSLINKEIKSLT